MNELFVCRKFVPVARNGKCNCSLVNLMPFFEYCERKRWSQLVSIIAEGTVSAVEAFLEENKTVRIVDRHGNGALHLSVIFQRMDLFNYLIEEDVSVNALNRYGQTSLHLAVITDSEEVLMKLIKKGADPNLSDENCCTSLHCAASRDSPRMCEILLKHGADIDFQNLFGKTPIYHACQYGSPETVYMLLYYGANANITDIQGILPITMAMQQSLDCGDEGIPQTHQDMHEVLFNYTLEKKKICVNLSTLTVALKIRSPLFLEMLKKIREVKYSRSDLVDLCRNAIVLNPTHFMWLMRKFPYVIRDMLVGPIDLHHKLTLGENVENMATKLMEFLTMLFSHRRAFNFVEGSQSFTYLVPTLVSLYKDKKISINTLQQVIYFLYSYGLPLELNHLVTIFKKCGYCQLFKSLLDLDIIKTHEHPQTMMPYLICDINMTVDKFLNQVSSPCKQYRASLRFFSSPRLRCFFNRDYRIRKKLKRLPQLPSLKELSRDMTRKHIIRTFKIDKTQDFYRLIKRLPVNEVYKQIITYERPIYRF